LTGSRPESAPPSLLPLLQGDVDLGIKEDQQTKGDDAHGHEAEPVEIDGINRVQSETRRFQLGHFIFWIVYKEKKEIRKEIKEEINCTFSHYVQSNLVS